MFGSREVAEEVVEVAVEEGVGEIPLALLDGVPLHAPLWRSSVGGPTLHCPRVCLRLAALFRR